MRLKTNITTGTIIRTTVLFIALANEILQHIGINPIPTTEQEVTELITLTATIGSSLWAWWENNSFTKNAIEADKKIKELNAKKILERLEKHED